MIRVSVRQRPDRHHLQLAYTDPLTGQRKTKSAGTADWRRAERAAAKWEAELRKSSAGSATWHIFRRRFEQEYLSRLSSSSRAPYAAALNHFERQVGKPRDINSITSSVISQFRARLSQVVRSDETVQKNLRHLRAALNWAQEIGLIKQSPKISTTALDRSMRGRALTVFEFVKIYKEAEGTWRDLLLALWLSGMRLSEAMALSFSPPVQLELNGKFPCVRFYLEGQKSRRDELVPLTPAMARFVKRFPTQSGPLFDVGVQPHCASKKISALGKAAGVRVSDKKFASAHDLRRSFGQRWALRVHPLVLQKIMRHRSMKTTMAYYVNLDADTIAEQIWSARNVHAHVHAAAAGPGFAGQETP